MKRILYGMYREMSDTFKEWYRTLDGKQRIFLWTAVTLVVLSLMCSWLDYPKEKATDSIEKQFHQTFPMINDSTELNLSLIQKTE